MCVGRFARKESSKFTLRNAGPKLDEVVGGELKSVPVVCAIFQPGGPIVHLFPQSAA